MNQIDWQAIRKLFPAAERYTYLNTASGGVMSAYAAEAARRAVGDKLGLPASCGLASNRTLAKIACDMAKPDGLICVFAGAEQEFLSPLPLAAVPGAGDRSGSPSQACFAQHALDRGRAGGEVVVLADVLDDHGYVRVGVRSPQRAHRRPHLGRHRRDPGGQTPIQQAIESVLRVALLPTSQAGARGCLNPE